MSTRSCPNCGTQYVATVRRCIDCDANLVDDVALSGDAEGARPSAEPADRGTHLTYELEGWGNQLKVTLEGMLDRAGIARAWEAGALAVPTEHEAAVDDLIATLEGDDLVDPDDDRPRVALEIEGLDADRQADLDAKLIASGLSYAWDEEGDLVILEDDEDSVMVIVESVLDDDDDNDDDPLAAQATLSDLYVAVDRLMKKPADMALARPVTEAVEQVALLSVPYGFSSAGWDELVTQAQGLVRSIDPGHDLDRQDGAVVADNDEESEARGRGAEEPGQETGEQVAHMARQLRDKLADLV